MIHTPDEMYALLPAIYRIRDAEQGYPLKALVDVLAREAGVVESDIAALYENWFIETCDEWLVPYIGDLIGVRGLNPVSSATFSERARVANTISYRRRKGTAAMLEQLARDTTGWTARAVEFFALLDTTQNYNHLRLQNFRTPDLRDTNALDLIGSPFDPVTRTVDVRHIASGRGKYNIPNIGLFLWRLQQYPILGGNARHVGGALGHYTFSPLGYEHLPLFNNPEPETDETHLAEEQDVPGPLRRRALYDELEQFRQSLVDATAHVPTYFTSDPVFRITIDGQPPVPPENILICDLSVWKTPSNSKKYPQIQPDGTVVMKSRPIRVAVDPALGRIAFASPAPVGKEVLVDYSYGFSGDLGGGPYDRAASVRALLTLDGDAPLLEHTTWQAGVSRTPVTGPGPIFSTFSDAIAAWNAVPKPANGVIAVMDSRTYTEDLTAAKSIVIPDESTLLIVAADWPQSLDANGVAQRPLGMLVPSELRPHLHGNITVKGSAPASSNVPGALIINGLLIEGDVEIVSGNLGEMHLQHTTLAPGHASGTLTVDKKNDNLHLRLERTICKTIEITAAITDVYCTDCIIDQAADVSLNAVTTPARLESTTFFGKVHVQSLEASDSIFKDLLTVERLQTGCVRYSFVPTHSHAPRRYRCQPELALKDITDPAAEAEIRARIVPVFTSETYDQPGYAQLAIVAPVEIATGAEDGAEMGAFCVLKQPQRVNNLRASLDEYLRFGLEAGITYAT